MGKLMMDTKRLFLSPCEETDETGTSCLKKENSFIPPYRSMNFPVYSGMLDQFKDSKDLQHYYEQGGLNGLEVILAGESDQGKILPEMINGVHLFFQVFWMDFWMPTWIISVGIWITRKRSEQNMLFSMCQK